MDTDEDQIRRLRRGRSTSDSPEIGLVLAVLFTLGISGLCSVLEAMILGTTAAEIESLRKTRPKLGAQLDKFKREMEETTSAILTLNTIANTLGATLVGGLAKIYGENKLIWFSVGLTVGYSFSLKFYPKTPGLSIAAVYSPFSPCPRSCPLSNGSTFKALQGNGQPRHTEEA